MVREGKNRSSRKGQHVAEVPAAQDGSPRALTLICSAGLLVTNNLPRVHCNDMQGCFIFLQAQASTTPHETGWQKCLEGALMDNLGVPLANSPKHPQSSFIDHGSRFFAKGSALLRQYRRHMISAAFLAVATLAVIAAVSGQQITFIPNGTFFGNPDGASETYSTTGGGIDLTGPFFQSLGTNGRSCATCHQPSDGMSVAAASVQQRFNFTQGLDPIFRTNDGSNCNHNIDVSTLAGRSAAYSLLRTRGLIRVAIGVPANADYQVVSVSNPYGCNESDVISQYRRPLPATNLRFLSTVMLDGRE